LPGGFFGILLCVQDDGRNWQQQKQKQKQMQFRKQKQRRNTGVLRCAQNDNRLGCIEGGGLDDDFSMLEEKAVRAWRE